MKCRKIFIMVVLAIFIFGVASVCASDVNDTYQMDISSNNEKTGNIETDSEILGVGEQGNYSDLRKDIENGGQLTKSYYIYCDGDGPTIEITTPSIIIEGNGAIIDMAGFNIQAFNVSACDVTIKNLTIINANYTKSGGAIIWNATDGTISDCNFTNNLALLRGGAIYWVGTNGTINNCNFISNTATKYSAGAIHWVGTNGTINNCNFTNNNGTQKGGAIYWEGTNGTINNCEFMNSTSISGGAIFWDPNAIMGILNNSNFIHNVGDEGGAIYWFGPNGLINNCNFTNNTAYYGGAVNWQKKFGTINNSNFISNTATNGGAIYWEGTNGTINNCKIFNATSTDDGAVYWFGDNGTINNSDFISNTATNGGAIKWTGTNGTLYNCNFTNNNASEKGGAIFTLSKINMLDSLFDNNSANQLGGALYVNETYTDSKINSTFINNCANNGGALYFNAEISNTTIDGSFIGNVAKNAGGAIFVRGKSLNNNFAAEFRDNEARGASGGAILFRNLAENSIFEDIYMNNYALYGGAIFFYNKANKNVFNTKFINNTAKSCGGAIFFHNTTNRNNFTGDFISNHALGKVDDTVGNGGAITFKDTSTNSIFTCDFINNTAALNGGGVNYRHTPYNITFNSNFINNTSPSGGGVNFFENFENVIFNGEFIGNSAVTGGAIAAGEGIIKDVSFKNNHAEKGSAVYFAEFGEITNCNFTNNTADYGGAVYFNRTGEVSKCSFINNTASEDGGAVWIYSGTVSNCNFTNNKATGKYSNSGAVYFNSNGNVTNCNFTNNTATYDGGAIWIYSGSVEKCNFTNNTAYEWGGAIRMKSGTVSNCNFTDNTAIIYGGAIWMNSGTVSNCNFTNNTAQFGGAIDMGLGNVSNCNFIGNNATNGSAIYFWNVSASKTVSNSCFFNNRANAEELQVTKNENNITITLIGNDNLLNAIYSINDAEVNITNVTYWSANGIANTGNSPTTPARSNKEAGQNITVGVIVNDKLVISEVRVTDENGMIVLDINAGDNYYITARHDTDSYYTEAQKTITNMTFNVNVTSQTTNNKTVNITAKSNIYNEFMQGKLLFILPNGTQINATYDTNGTWWALHTFDDAGDYNINASYIGLDNVTINNATIIIRYDVSVEVNNKTLDLLIDDTFTIVATTTPEGLDVDYVPDDSGVYSIDENGNLIALKEGKGSILVKVGGDGVYAENSTIINVTVSKIPAEINIANATLNLEVNDEIATGAELIPGDAGNLTYTVSNSSVVKVENGKIIALAEGSTTITVSFAGDDKYAAAENKSIAVNVVDLFINVTAENVTKFFSGPEKFIVNVTNSKGKAISGESVLITINGVTYKRTTNENGTASLNINLNSGEYPVIVSVDDVVVNFTVTVKSTIDAADVVKVFRNATQYYARFTDSNGNILANTMVSFNINGIIYNRTTNGNGTAKLNINLDAGNYILTATNLVTGEMKSNNIKVISLIESSDLTKYYRNASQFVVRIHSADGGYVGAGEEVTFNINGVIYTRTTNATGHAKLNINLGQGSYIITTYYKDCSQGNNITILPILSADDLSMKYMDGSQFKAQLVDGEGKPYADQRITFNINGVLYNRVTGSDGVAKLNIRLMAGEYIITSSYDGFNISNKITIRG